MDAKHVGAAQAKFKYDATSSSASGFLKKLKGKALMAKLHRDEAAALYNSYPKDFAVCREAVPMRGSKYAYEVESCLPLPFQTRSREAKVQTSFNVKGVADKRAMERAHARAEALAEAPVEWNVCGKVQYRCIRQVGMDGTSCDTQVKSEREHGKLAVKARLKIATTERCVKLDVHGRRLIEDDGAEAAAAAAGASARLGGGDRGEGRSDGESEESSEQLEKSGSALSDVMSAEEVVDRALAEGAAEDAAMEEAAASS